MLFSNSNTALARAPLDARKITHLDQISRWLYQLDLDDTPTHADIESVLSAAP